MPLLPNQICHILSICGIASAHRHKIAEIIEAIPKCIPCIDRSHGKSAKSSVVTRRFQPLRCRIFGIGAVFTLHCRNQIIYQFIVKLICKLNRQTVITTILFACVVIGWQYDDEWFDFSILYRMIDHMLKRMWICIRSHQRCLIAPATVTQIKDIVFFFIRIPIWKIHPRILCKLLCVLLIGKGFPCIIRQFNQSSLLTCQGIISIGNIL